MAVSFQIENVSIAQDYHLSVGMAANLLRAGTKVILADVGSDNYPEMLSASLPDGTLIGAVPRDLCLEIREITFDFEALVAEITHIDKTAGLNLSVTISLHDFTWDESSGIPILRLSSNNPGIHSAKSSIFYGIYQTKMRMARLKQEEAALRSSLRGSRRW